MRSRGRALHKKCIAGIHRASLQSRTPSCRGGPRSKRDSAQPQRMTAHLGSFAIETS